MGFCTLEQLDCLVGVLERSLTLGMVDGVETRKVAVFEVFALSLTLVCRTDEPAMARLFDGGSGQSLKGSSSKPSTSCVSVFLLLARVRAF